MPTGIPGAVTRGSVARDKGSFKRRLSKLIPNGVLGGLFFSSQLLFLVSHPGAVAISHPVCASVSVPLTEGFRLHHVNG